jgi:hypothetical protein
MPCLEILCRSKNDTELLAALVALKIAHLAGICAEKPHDKFKIHRVLMFCRNAVRVHPQQFKVCAH